GRLDERKVGMGFHLLRKELRSLIDGRVVEAADDQFILTWGAEVDIEIDQLKRLQGSLKARNSIEFILDRGDNFGLGRPLAFKPHIEEDEVVVVEGEEAFDVWVGLEQGVDFALFRCDLRRGETVRQVDKAVEKAAVFRRNQVHR